MNRSFHVIKSIQATSDVYIATLPVTLIADLLTFVDETLEPEQRSQREVSPRRVVGLVDYISDNLKSYILAPLLLELQGDFDFISNLPEGDQTILPGILKLDQSAILTIIDGQHRASSLMDLTDKGLLSALEAINVQIHVYKNNKVSQKRFSDINQNQKKVSKSLNLLYSHDDLTMLIVKNVFRENPDFAKLIDKSRDTVSKKSKRLFALKDFYKITDIVFKELKKHDFYHATVSGMLVIFWQQIYLKHSSWYLLQGNEVTAEEIKTLTVSTKKSVIYSFAYLAIELLLEVKEKSVKSEDWKKLIPQKLDRFNLINWHLEDNEELEEALIVDDKIVRGVKAAPQVAKYILDFIQND